MLGLSGCFAPNPAVMGTPFPSPFSPAFLCSLAWLLVAEVSPATPNLELEFSWDAPPGSVLNLAWDGEGSKSYFVERSVTLDDWVKSFV